MNGQASQPQESTLVVRATRPDRIRYMGEPYSGFKDPITYIVMGAVVAWFLLEAPAWIGTITST